MSPLGRQCPFSTHWDIQIRTLTLDTSFKVPALPGLKYRLEPGPPALDATVPACKKSAHSVKGWVNDRLYLRIKKSSGLKITINSSFPQKYQLQKIGFYWLTFPWKICNKFQVWSSKGNPYYSSRLHNYFSCSHREWL